MHHLALGSKTDSIARSFEGHSIKCPNIYGLHIHESYLNEIIHLAVLKLLACQQRILSTADSLWKQFGDQQNVKLDLNPNCLTVR